MLTNMHIAVIGGDARHLEIIRKLIELDSKVSLVGFDLLNSGFIGVERSSVNELKFNEIDAIILPVGGTSLEGEVMTTFSKEKVVLTEEQIKRTPSSCTIYSGISNDYLDSLTKKNNRKLVKLFDRDDVAIYNSIPTVEGTIMVVIQNTDFTIHHSKVAVLGFGRTGMSVARAFQGLGAKVRVGVRRPEHIARIVEMGMDGFYLQDLEKQAQDIDVCINTIPHLIVTSKVISKMQSHAIVVDLASKPGGTDFRYAEKRGIKAILAPSLPGIVAPKTAGTILANVLTELLEKDAEKRKEKE